MVTMKKNTMMVQAIKDILKMVCIMEKVYVNGQMVQHIQESGPKVNVMAVGHAVNMGSRAVGLIKSAWEFKGDKWVWEFTVPDGAFATVTLPGETESNDYKSGTYRIEKDL